MVTPVGKAFWIATCLDCTWRSPRLTYEYLDPKTNKRVGQDPMAEAQRRAEEHKREAASA